MLRKWIRTAKKSFLARSSPNLGSDRIGSQMKNTWIDVKTIFNWRTRRKWIRIRKGVAMFSRPSINHNIKLKRWSKRIFENLLEHFLPCNLFKSRHELHAWFHRRIFAFLSGTMRDGGVSKVEKRLFKTSMKIYVWKTNWIIENLKNEKSYFWVILLLFYSFAKTWLHFQQIKNVCIRQKVL